MGYFINKLVLKNVISFKIFSEKLYLHCKYNVKLNNVLLCISGKHLVDNFLSRNQNGEIIKIHDF